MGMIERKKAILLNEPHLETASGSVAEFNTDRVGLMKHAVVSFEATQDGTGTPSPSNVRAINGINTLVMNVSPTTDAQDGETYSRSFSTARAKGIYDFVTGQFTDLARVMTVSGDSEWQAVGSKFYRRIYDADFQNSTQTDNGYVCNMYQFSGVTTSGSAGVTQDKSFYLQRVKGTASYNRLWVYDTSYTLDQFKALLNITPLQITYPVNTSADFADVKVKTYRGINNVWSDAGDVDVTYWVNKPVVSGVVDTSVVIETYHAWIRANSAVTTRSDVDLCVSQWYTITNNSSVTLIVQTTNTDTNVPEYICHAAREAGTTGNGSRILLQNPASVTQNRVFTTTATDKNEIRFTLDSRYLNDSYAYVVETGEVVFAGINTPYYGKSYISN